MTKPKKPARTYSDRTLKILWGRSAGRCAVPECRVDLLVEETDFDPVVVIGDIAHIAAASDQGPRAQSELSPKNRDEYENLILLCRNCHARIDGQTHANPSAWIKQLKAAHEAWVRDALPERGKSTLGWIPVILEGDHPIDAEAALNALAPDFASVSPITLKVGYTADASDLMQRIRDAVISFSQSGDPFEKRFAIFPLSSVSACIALGYVLTNRPNVRLFQHFRQDRSWVWPSVATPVDELSVSFPAHSDSSAHEVGICFHLSVEIAPQDLPEQLTHGATVVDVRVAQPSVHWLQKPSQLERLAEITCAVFERIGRDFPQAEKWHIFFAGPAPGAVKVGQQMNPTMTPPTQLYEFSKAGAPKYRASILLRPSNT